MGNINFSKLIPWIPAFIEGTFNTIILSLLSVILGLILGLLAVTMKRSHRKIVRWIGNAYTQVIRGTPMILQLIIWLYAFPPLGIQIPSIPALGDVFGSREFLTAIIALGVNSGAYVCELLRGGLDSIDKGQMEAGRSLGLKRSQVMKYIILPQAIKVVLPGLGNEFIQMIKESAIVSTVGIFDVMYTSNIVKASTYSIFEPLIAIALIYFVMTNICTMLLGLLERRLKTDA